MAKARKVKHLSPTDLSARAAARILRTRLKEFYSHWPDPTRPLTPTQLHDLRISGKRLRYSAESLRALYPDRLALLIDLLRKLQDLLGEMQDCDTQRGRVAADLARRALFEASGEERAVLAKLIQHYEQRQVKLFTEFADLWRGVAGQQFRAALEEMVSHPLEGAAKGLTIDG